MRTYNCAIATICWVVMFTLMILGKFALRLDPIVQLDWRILKIIKGIAATAAENSFVVRTVACSVGLAEMSSLWRRH
jgi:hypothetical protein